MALQEQTLKDLARQIREQARGLDIRSRTLQSELFGSEPTSPTDINKPSEVTVESVLRESLSILREVESQFARTISRIGEENTGNTPAASYPYSEGNAVASGPRRY